MFLRYLKMNTETSKARGFSLIEVMIACFVLTVGILAMIDLMAISIRNSIGARDQIIASELAQEGMELVRNIRDNNFANDKKAFEDKFPNVDRDNCRIDKNSTDIKDCNNGNDRFRLYNSIVYIPEFDYNDNGVLDSADTLLIQQILAHAPGAVCPPLPKNCDVNGNGKIDSGDAMRLGQIVNGLGSYNYYVLNNNRVGTKFQRKIMLIYDTGQANSAASVNLTSMVIWGSDFPADCGSCNSLNKCICVADVLTDWR
ncbi:MAG: dockerin type I domain-containing protein [bacterium]|nr:dockerin type I domain-containing protein [bacterium]